jgi:hypothetical protein
MTPNFKSLLVVNFLAGPGAGKSAIAAALYAQLKMDGVNCELVTEKAKGLIWDGNQALNNQPFVTMAQFHRLYQLVGKVDVAISDGSLLLGRVRSKHWVPQEFYPCVTGLYHLFANINFWVNRPAQYQTAGRVHNHEQAIASDQVIRDLAADVGVAYTEIEAGDWRTPYEMISSLVRIAA